MTVKQALRDLVAVMDMLQKTPCVRCGHGYGSHGIKGCCTFTSFNNMKGVACKCREFVDPEETLT